MLKYFVKRMENQTSVLAKLSNESLSEKEFEILENININGIAKIDKKGRKKIQYIIPAQITLLEYLEQGANIHRFYNFWVQFLETIKAVEEKSLYVKNMVLDSELIFVDGNTGKFFFLYMPVKTGCIQKSMVSFLEEILSVLQGNEFEEIKKFFHRCPNSTIEEMSCFIKESYPQIYMQLGINSDRKKAATKKKAVLIRHQTKEERTIEKDIFHVGTAEHMDYRLDNHRISRNHLSFVKKGGSICVMEAQASNGTYVNGVKLGKEDSIELHHGDFIQIADEEFLFKVEN